MVHKHSKEHQLTLLDLKTDNLMLSLEDSSMMSDFSGEEAKDPSQRKTISDHRIIYRSRQFRRPLEGKGYGLPILCDFGEARIGTTQNSSPFVQPHIYRAPEVIFEMPWGSAIDIWNLCALVSYCHVSLCIEDLLIYWMQIWDLSQKQHLFDDIFDKNGHHDAFKHLALMYALIGSPPPEFIQRSETTKQCFDTTGESSSTESCSLYLREDSD